MTITTTRRALICLLGILTVLVALVSLPAAAQETSSATAAVSSSSAAPAPYHPAAAAFATPKPAAAASSEGPDPDRRWEIEFHGGGMLPTNPNDGTGVLPAPGAPVGSSRAVSSWYFGDGALLFNQVGPGFAGVPAIVPLDPMLTRAAVQRQPNGSFGGRISYEITPRFTGELSLDYSLGEVELTSRSLQQIATTSASFVSSFNGLFNCCFPPVSLTVTSTPTIHRSDGQQIFFTGALNINLVTQGRIIPYVTLGGGFIHNLGDMPFVNLVGHYTVDFFGGGSAPINETDTVRLHYRSNETSAMGMVGGGVKYYVTPRWGIRVDVRAHMSGNTLDNLLDATPSRVNGAITQTSGYFNAGRSLIFSSDATVQNSLSGPALANFRTFAGSGIQFQIAVSGGVFYRF